MEPQEPLPLETLSQEEHDRQLERALAVLRAVVSGRRDFSCCLPEKWLRPDRLPEEWGAVQGADQRDEQDGQLTDCTGQALQARCCSTSHKQAGGSRGKASR